MMRRINSGVVTGSTRSLVQKGMEVNTVISMLSSCTNAPNDYTYEYNDINLSVARVCFSVLNCISDRSNLFGNQFSFPRLKLKKLLILYKLISVVHKSRFYKGN